MAQEDNSFPWWGWVTGAIIFALYFSLLMPEAVKFTYLYTENIVAPLSIAVNSFLLDIFLAATLFVLAFGSLIAPIFLNFYIVKHIQNDF